MVSTNQSLYERLGGAEVVAAIASDIVDMHMQNPKVSPRYKKSDIGYLKGSLTNFIGAGIGGPEVYTGPDVNTAHQAMNISDQEFIEVIDDIMKALDKNGVGQREKDEMLAILYSMKGDTVHI